MTYLAAFCCAFLAVFDVRSGRIPNPAVLVFSLAGFVWSAAAGGGAGLFSSVCGAGGMFLLLWALYLMRLMGAGDVKLFMMLGVFFGWPGVLRVFAMSVLAGSVYAVIRFLVKGDAGRRFMKLASYFEAVLAGGKPEPYIAAADREAKVPFAIFAAFGAFMCAAVPIG